MADWEPICSEAQKEISLEDGMNLFFQEFRLQEQLDSRSRSPFFNPDDDSDPSEDPQMKIRLLGIRLRHLVEQDRIKHLCAFRQKYGLDPTDLEILMHQLYWQSKPGGSGFGRTTDGASILNLPNADTPLVSLAYRIMPGSALVDGGLIQLFGQPFESVFERSLRIPDRIILELTNAPGNSRKPSAQADERRDPRGDSDIAEVRRARLKLADVILSEDQKNKLQATIVSDSKAIEEWGLGKVAPYGKGKTIIAFGPPGTGKTMLGEAIAGEMGVRLMVARFPNLEAGVVGDTEKNIARLFAYAKKAKCVLMVDECDAVLCKRLSGNRSNDRYFNQQLLVFCQEMEKFDGVLVLTTNRAVDLDEAISRRVALKLEMGIPAERERTRIWQMSLASVPLADDVDVQALARRFAFAGGYIKNAVFAAARRAIVRAEGDSRPAVVTMDDLAQAATEETIGFQEAGSSGKIGFRTQ